jgi:nucleoside-diphosphate-sugar epimerase
MSDPSTGRSHKTLVTGSNGYLGGHVAARLSAEGWQVIELARRPSESALSSGRAVRFQLGDSIEPRVLEGTELIVHCAYDFSRRGWSEIREVNVRGTEKLMLAARQAGVRRQVFVSSMSAYAGCKSNYGQAKLELESVALSCGALVLRPGLIYSEQPGGIFANLVARASGSSTIPLIGNGTQVQYLVHEADLCRVIVDYAAARFESPGTPVAAANETPWRFRDLLSELGKARGKQLRFIPLPWRLVWLGLRGCEVLHLPVDFRSDSLLGLVYPDPAPPFGPARKLGLQFRPFTAGNLKL